MIEERLAPPALGVTTTTKERVSMRSFKLVVTLVAVLAVSAAAAVSASANPTFNPGAAGTKFTGKSGKAVFASIECKASEIASGNGELTGTESANFIVDFKGCKSLGLAANSLNDAAEVVLVTFSATTCYTNVGAGELKGGLILEPTPVHIEVPAGKQLVVVSGRLVAGLEPENKKFNLGQPVIAQKGGVQAIDGCRTAKNELVTLNEEGTEKIYTLLALENEVGAPKRAGLEMKENSITFAGGHEEEFST